jgi:hypothetical protein
MDIAAEFVSYFKNIFHSTCANNDRQPASTTPQQEPQGYQIQYREILKSMKKNASPRPDDFNVTFYLAAWSWIGDDVTNLI